MIPIFLLTLFLLPLAATSASLVRTYEHGPIPFDANGDLYFTIDLETSTAYLAVRVKNVSSIITETSNYVGIGISEPTSGSMLGSDIATVEFDTGATDVCQLVDRHVPFVAYPLGETAPNSPSVFPIEDKCQDDASWTLVSCERDAEAGEMILEVSRSLSAHDEQDRDIPPGINNVIYAFGGSFAYHGSRRASTRVILYQEEGGDESLIGAGQPELPADIDGTFDITATEYTVPDEKVTIYACTSKRFVVPKGEKKMIVAMEPLINSTNDALVHHLTLYLCAGEEYLDQTSSTVECTTADNDIDGPLANPFAKCSTFIFGCKQQSHFFLIPSHRSD